MSFKIFKYSDKAKANNERKTFSTQTDAIDMSNKTGSSPVFAYEIDGSGRRRYLTCSLDEFWEFYQDLNSERKCHYEVIVSERQAKLYADLEFDQAVNSEKDGVLMTKTIIEIVQRQLKSEFSLDICSSDCLILDSSNSKKFSVHLVFFKVIFVTNQAIKIFMKKLVSSLSSQENELLQVKSKSGERTLFLDSSVYSKNRNFRIFLSSKFGDRRPLVLSNADTSSLDLLKKYSSSAEVDKIIFRRSIITNVDEEAKSVLGANQTEAEDTLETSSRIECSDLQPKSLDAAVELNPEEQEFQKVYDFVQSLVQPGKIRKCLSNDKMVRFEISGFKYCHQADREHSSNHIFFVYFKSSRLLEQSCYSDKCRKSNVKQFSI